MGAWGHGYFEDDAALDFMEAIEAADQPKEMINESLDLAIAAEYLECDEGNAAIVAAAYVDGQLNGTTFSSADKAQPLEVDTFARRHPDLDCSDLKGKAVQALQKLLGDQSELKELWAENEEDYPAWQEGIQQLRQRLEQ